MIRLKKQHLLYLVKFQTLGNFDVSLESIMSITPGSHRPMSRAN